MIATGVELREVSPDAYARDVLPLTAALWGNGRTLDMYVAQTLEIARSPYGKRYYRTFGLFEGKLLVASMKRYERTVRIGTRQVRVMGIGAVFTPDEYRGRGYASHMIASTLDTARAEGYDLAYLFSDIHPTFYSAIGFNELPSRSISVRADTLSADRITVEPIGARDWTAVRACFDATQSTRAWAMERPPTVWSWVRMRLAHDAEHAHGQPVQFLIRKNRSVIAYLLGQRLPKRDALVVDEYGYANENAKELMPALLRAGAGDLRRITGWLPPDGARSVLPRGSVKTRSDAIWMAAPLSHAGQELLTLATEKSPSDGIWSTDHI
jgi:GNAT superfamily N-acetyltransferase